MHSIRCAVLDTAIFDDRPGIFHPQVTARWSRTTILDDSVAEYCRRRIRKSTDNIQSSPKARCGAGGTEDDRLFGRSSGDQATRHIQRAVGDKAHGHTGFYDQSISGCHGEAGAEDFVGQAGIFPQTIAAHRAAATLQGNRIVTVVGSLQA